MSNYHKLFFIKKKGLFVLAVVFCLSCVLAGGSWDSFEEENGSLVVFVENLSNNSKVSEFESFDNSNLEDFPIENEDSLRYTSYFYIALGIGAVGLLIAGLFIYLFLKRPKNQWEK